MATILETTSTPIFNISGISSPGDMIVLINTLQAQIKAGYTITAAEGNNIIKAYNAFISHYHSVTDYAYINSGDLGSYTNILTNYTTAALNTSNNYFSQNTTSLPIGQTIASSSVITMVNNINSIRTHGHIINDITDN